MSEHVEHAVEDEWGGAWYALPAECAICGFAWTAVYPACCTHLECSECGYMTTAPHGQGDLLD